MLVSKELMQGLNALLSRSRDAEKGYIEAANHLNMPRLRKWFLEYADQRKAFSAELASEILALGGDPDNDTNLLGELYRAWMDLKGTISDDKPIAMLEEYERGEQRAIEDYEAVLAEHPHVPASTCALLQQHKTKIGEALVLVESMKEVLRAHRQVREEGREKTATGIESGCGLALRRLWLRPSNSSF